MSSFSSTVEMRGGRPTLVLNGQPYAPLIYALTDCPGARLTWEEVPARNLKQFAEQGVRLFQCDLWLDQMVQPDGSLDVSIAQRQVAGVVAQCADAAVMLRLHVNAPMPWCAANPDECVGYADATPNQTEPWGLRRVIGTDGGRPVRASFASMKWQSWANTHLETFCRQFGETREGGSVFSLQIANGMYGEWHQFGFLHHDPDTGVVATRLFREWLRARYQTEAALAAAWNRPPLSWDDVQPPDSPSRETSRCGPLRDPRGQQDVIDYFTWLHNAMADALLRLAATVKHSWPRPIVTAAFQGYFYGQFGRNAAGSHLAHDKVLASPHLDCLCSPQSYTERVRAMGGSGHARGIIGAVRRAGKLWLDENDHGTTAVGCPWDTKFTTTPQDDIAYLRRNTLQPFLRGGGQWWFDFGMIAGTPEFAGYGNVGWWDDPILLKEIRAIQSLAQSRMNLPFIRPADTLVIHDPWSFAHTIARRIPLQGFAFGDQPPIGPDPFSARGMDGMLEGLYHSGLVFDEALITELPTMDLAPYRLILFGTTPIIDDNVRDFISRQLATAGRHIVLTGFTAWGNRSEVSAELAASLSGVSTAIRALPTPTSTVTLDGHTEEQKLEPPQQVPVYDVPSTDVIGRWSDGSTSAARRETDAATWWTFAVAPIDPSILRILGQRAGCHVINDHNDATMMGDGLLMIHTLEGGPRSLRLPGGGVASVTLPPRSTTVLDAQSGAVLLA